MYIYESNSEMEELAVVNLTHVRVDYKRHLEEMLGVRKGATERRLQMSLKDADGFLTWTPLLYFSANSCFRSTQTATRI